MFIGSYSAPAAKSLKAKVCASLLALAAAVALPQAAHLIGYATGTGNAIGTIFIALHGSGACGLRLRRRSRRF